MMQQAFISEHAAEARIVWDAFAARQPIRPPVVLGTATQFFIFNKELNPGGGEDGGAVTFEQYCTDADTMLEFQLEAATWRSERIAPYCGDATRHFGWLKEDLGVNEFETGFPVDHWKIGRELGPDVLIHGGPNVVIIRDGSPETVAMETRRILDSGVCGGGWFVLREANNLALGTPIVSLAAMYETAGCWSGYRG